MFGLSMKEKCRDALQRSVQAVLIGGIFHHSQVEKYNINKVASAYLYTETQAQLIYVIGTVFNHLFIGKYRWATFDFLQGAILETLIEFDKTNGLYPGTISSFVFKRYDEFDRLSPEERAIGKHFQDSARMIESYDPTAKEEEIASMLENLSYNFMDELLARFRTF